MMKIIFAVLLFMLAISTEAQQPVTVYTHNGSKYVGTLMRLDSAGSLLKVKILGGSEFCIALKEIDSIRWEEIAKENKQGKPYFGFGLGAATNASKSVFQLDLQAGYEFNRKWVAGVGFCNSEVSAAYADVRYFPYSKDFFSAGIFSQIGVVLTPLYYWSEYYYNEVKLRGLYTNHGISLKLSGQKSRSFSLNIGYQFVDKREIYSYYQGETMTKVFLLNRYLIQGVFAF